MGCWLSLLPSQVCIPYNYIYIYKWYIYIWYIYMIYIYIYIYMIYKWYIYIYTHIWDATDPCCRRGLQLMAFVPSDLRPVEVQGAIGWTELMRLDSHLVANQRPKPLMESTFQAFRAKPRDTNWPGTDVALLPSSCLADKPTPARNGELLIWI